VYMAGVLSGSLGAAACDSRSYLSGASGGVYALLAAHASNVILNWNQMEYAWARAIVIVCLAGVDLTAAFYERYHTIGVRVSYAAHLAGALCGFLIGLVVLRNLKVRKWQQVAQLVALALFLFLLVTALVYNIMMTPPFDQRPW
jgi:rhomboid-related protein 1/2/3